MGAISAGLHRHGGKSDFLREEQVTNKQIQPTLRMAWLMGNLIPRIYLKDTDMPIALTKVPIRLISAARDRNLVS